MCLGCRIQICIYVSGDAMGGTTYTLPSAVAAGAVTDISVAMTAPNKTGTIRGDWRMSTARRTILRRPGVCSGGDRRRSGCNQTQAAQPQLRSTLNNGTINVNCNNSSKQKIPSRVEKGFFIAQLAKTLQAFHVFWLRPRRPQTEDNPTGYIPIQQQVPPTTEASLPSGWRPGQAGVPPRYHA